MYTTSPPKLDDCHRHGLGTGAVVASPTLDRALYAFTEAEYQASARALRSQGHELQVVRYRGLAGLDLPTLASTCVHPETRMLHALGRVDADAMQRVIGKGEPQPTLF
jgi:DNA gyrase/topoisomerase IV subunit B